MLVIVDYGMGNLRSVEKAFKRINANPIVSSKVEDIANATKLVLPGVGFFKTGMDKLNELGLIDVLTKKVIEEKTPILGICLGMQLFTSYSEEGESDGLDWVNATTKSFQLDKFKVPHMGWNMVEHDPKSPLFDGINKGDAFYFVHSYFVNTEKVDHILCKTEYGINFHSGIIHDNILGVQFHPEKSHSTGLKLLSNFIEKY